MRIDTGQHLRMDQRMKLAPRMIQSMEILQMTSQALEARIEEELSSNPTLELREATADPSELEQEREQEKRDDRDGVRELVVEDGEAKSQTDDFERLANISEEVGEGWEANTSESGESYHPVRNDGERDKKMDAMANTAARPTSLTDQLLDQWRMVETEPHIAKAGAYLIGFIDDDGYLRTNRQTLIDQLPSGAGITPEHLDEAMPVLQQSLEPVGIGARDLRECLLLQIDAKREGAWEEGHGSGVWSLGGRDSGLGARVKTSPNGQEQAVDPQPDPASSLPETHNPGPETSSYLSLERTLVSDYLKDIEVNRLPRIAKCTGADIETIKKALLNLRQFHPHPGRLLIEEMPRAITPDAIVEFDEEQDRYVALLFTGRLPSVQISPAYLKMAADRAVERRTREFIGNNLRSARWLIDAIQQRQNTLLRVINVVLEAQREFFDQGPQALKPLPMTQVADQLGIHVATVSRAVSDKYLQTPRGIFPLRMFFSGGTATDSGEEMSWAAVQAKLQEIIDQEDKANPLSDDELVEKLKAAGIEIARRTIAKYRKQLQIPTARQRKQF